MQLSTVGIKRAKIRCKTRKTKKLNNNTKDSAAAKIKGPTWWYPIIRVWVKASKRSMANMVCRYTIKEVIPSRTSWWPQRIKIQSSKRVGSSIHISVAGLTGDEEYIGESSWTFGERFKEHQKAPPPQSMTIATSLVIRSLLIISTLLGGKTKTSAEQLKKHYT